MVPVIENGKMKFSGQPNSSESVGVATVLCLKWILMQDKMDQTSTGHSILEFVESQGLNGIEDLLFAIELSDPHNLAYDDILRSTF